ncbi:MAG: FkbM family methyltransferase, partial [Lachnospiraceae bacterium]|nr:FkbM family methyltransferase [bacterium]MDY5516563.1 FkbM family methyltransferase [Lachnospiraceae bacterium]
DEDIVETISLLKMDIEGAEYQALLGAKNHIQNDHPVLAISVYHSNEDLLRIPRLIHDICPDYRFYLRYNGGTIYPSEYVLIAVPCVCE